MFLNTKLFSNFNIYRWVKSLKASFSIRFLRRSHNQTNNLRNQVVNMTNTSGEIEPFAMSSGATGTTTGFTARHHVQKQYSHANSMISNKSSICSKPRGSNRRSRTTALLIAMSVSYGILWLPFIIYTLYSHLSWGKTMSDPRGMKLIDEVCKMISMLSICVNPFLYGYLNTNFNREFNIIFSRVIACCMCKKSAASKQQSIRRFNSRQKAVFKDQQQCLVDDEAAGRQMPMTSRGMKRWKVGKTSNRLTNCLISFRSYSSTKR